VIGFAFIIAMVLSGLLMWARAHDYGAWVTLDAPGEGQIEALALAPRFPEDGTIVMLRREESNARLYRSTTQGNTWDALGLAPWRDSASATGLPAPGSATTGELTFARQEAAASLLFAVTYYTGDLRIWSLYRSPDAGASWSQVLAGRPVEAAATSRTRPAVETPRLRLSPDFEHDGIGILVAGGSAHRTEDRGQAWTPLTIPDAARFNDAAFSPDFASDRTLFLAAVGDDPRELDQHLGVLVSHDGGVSWSEASQGLAREDRPHRYVHQLAISPTFPEDRTLFAIGTAPLERPASCLQAGPAVGRTGAIFRSTDGAETWHEVRRTGTCIINDVVALSPNFAQDGLAFHEQSNNSGGPSSARCAISISKDHGANWEPLAPFQGWCRPPRFWGDRTRSVAAYGEGGSQSTLPRWTLSTDGGETWNGFADARPLPGSIIPPDRIWPSPGFARDGTVFASRNDISGPKHLWRYTFSASQLQPG
jgi:hypothetical protein